MPQSTEEQQQNNKKKQSKIPVGSFQNIVSIKKKSYKALGQSSSILI